MTSQNSERYFTLPIEVTGVNREALGESWGKGRELALFHREVLEELSREAGPQPNPRDETALLLACHGWNVFVAVMDSTVAGKFDVAAYLLRPLFDIGPLILVCANDDERAQRFRNDKYRGGQARKDLVSLVNTGEPELAEGVSRIWKDDADATHELSHAGYVHFDKLVEQRGDAIHPILGGRPDAHEAKGLASAAIAAEVKLLRWLLLSRPGYFGERWLDRFEAIETPLSGWIKAAQDPLER